MSSVISVGTFEARFGHAIHAPANGRAVVVTDVTSKYWRKNFVEAVDVLD